MQHSGYHGSIIHRAPGQCWMTCPAPKVVAKVESTF
jgi:hypothetical protein